VTKPIYGLGPRIAAFLRDAYPRDRAKLIARRFDVSESTAERWLRGVAPTTAYLEEMYGEWGAPFVRAVFLEAFDVRDPRIAALESQQKARQTTAPPKVPGPPPETPPLSGGVEYSARRLYSRAEASARHVGPSVCSILADLVSTIPAEPIHRRILRAFGA